MLLSSDLEQKNLDSSAMLVEDTKLFLGPNHLVWMQVSKGYTVVWPRSVSTDSTDLCYMTLLVNITDLQLKLGDFVDERHEGIWCSSLSPSSKLGKMQQRSVNTFFSCQLTNTTWYIHSKAFVEYEAFFFLNHTLNLVSVLTLKCFNS